MDGPRLDQDDVDSIMGRFRRAYGAADAEGLTAILTDDFEWHMHYGEPGSDSPGGRVRKGVTGMVEELRWRRENWTDVQYEDLAERPAGDLVVQTFTTKGIDPTGREFHVNVVDLYRVRDGRICHKDTYWKQL